MRILIDGDGCPVVRETAALSREFSVPCLIFCDTSHSFSLPGDLIVTQDYGLAAMCLSRGARALHQDGFCYDDGNIGGLLEVRAFSGRVRRGGGRLKGPKKRTASQDAAYCAALRRILEEDRHAAGNS